MINVYRSANIRKEPPVVLKQGFHDFGLGYDQALASSIELEAVVSKIQELGGIDITMYPKEEPGDFWVAFYLQYPMHQPHCLMLTMIDAFDKLAVIEGIDWDLSDPVFLGTARVRLLV